MLKLVKPNEATVIWKDSQFPVWITPSTVTNCWSSRGAKSQAIILGICPTCWPAMFLTWIAFLSTGAWREERHNMVKIEIPLVITIGGLSHQYNFFARAYKTYKHVLVGYSRYIDRTNFNTCIVLYTNHLNLHRDDQLIGDIISSAQILVFILEKHLRWKRKRGLSL